MTAGSLHKTPQAGRQRYEKTSPSEAAQWAEAIARTARPYKALLPRELVVNMALLYLPRDGTDWLPRLRDAHRILSECWMVGDAADVPTKVAQEAFERMGYQYMEVENGEWRRRLSAVAFDHWTLFRNNGGVTAS
jgi:hypothetical protein